MLLKAEKILSPKKVLNGMSDAEIQQIIRSELSAKIMDEMIANGLIKTEICTEMHEYLGKIAKVKASVRVYNPDD